MKTSIIDTIRIDHEEKKYFVKITQTIWEKDDKGCFDGIIDLPKPSVDYHVVFNDKDSGKEIKEIITLNVFKSFSDQAKLEWKRYHGIKN